MTIEEAIRTIIQQNKKIVELIKSNGDSSNTAIAELEVLVNANKINVDNLKNIITTFGLTSTSITQNNDIFTIREVLNSNSRYNTVFKIKESLTSLGDNYKSLYDLANTVKTFIESTDTADSTINTWREIENFLAGIEDSESLLDIINHLTLEIDTLANTVENEIELLRTEIDTNIANKLNELKVKDVDNKTIVCEDGIIKVNIVLGRNYGSSINTPSPYNSAVRTMASKTETLNIDNRTYVYDGTRDINNSSVNIVEERALAKHLNEVNTEIQSTKDDVQVLSGQLLILTTGAKVNGSCSPSTIYKANNTNLTVTGNFSASDANLIPKRLMIIFGGEEIAVAENSKTVRYTESINLTTNSKTFSIRAEVDPNNTGAVTVLTTLTTVNARYPIYYGFGNSADEVISSGTKVGATTTASRTYTSTNNKTEDCYFYILVPTDIGTPTKFSMGGAPASMNTTSETLNGVAYKVIKSGGIYAPGAKVEITAS